MKSWEVVGYAVDGAVYCPNDVPTTDEDESSPIFAGDEGWESDSCDECHWPLDDNRTIYGTWNLTARIALCLRCSPLAEPKLKDHDVFPILAEWNGPDTCEACFAIILPEPDEGETED